MTRVLLIPSLLLLLLGAVCFFASAGGPAATQEIVFASPTEAHTLDPAGMSWMQDIRLAMGLWEGLLTYDPQTLAPAPGVAERWEVTPDGRTYTFHLRADARWSNGDRVTSRDFVFAWQRALQPTTAAAYLDMFFHIEGAEAYNTSLSDPKATPRDFSTVGLATPDDRTLVVRLAHPCTYFPDLAAFPPFYPLHQASLQPFEIKGKSETSKLGPAYDKRWTHPPHLVSNGAFYLKEWRFKQHMLLEPNPHYWDRAAVRCPRLRVVTYEDEQAGFLAYQSGVVDIMSYLPKQFVPDLLELRKTGRRSDVHFQPVFGTYYYQFNCRRKPFDDPRVRRAFALAIDKRQIVDNITRGGQQPLDVIVPPGYIPGYTSPTGLPQNIQEAQRLLAEAGYPGGQGLPPVEFLYNKEGAHLKVALALRQMWEQNLGVRIETREQESRTFGEDRRKHQFAIARAGWYGDYLDPTTWLDLARTGNANNDGQYSNPAFDALMAQADAEVDPAKRFAILTRAERLLTEQDMPFLPLYQYSDGLMYDPARLAGCEPNVRMITQFKYLRRIHSPRLAGGNAPSTVDWQTLAHLPPASRGLSVAPREEP